MTGTPATPTQAQRAADRLRRVLARRLAALGQRRGNPFRRLAAAVLRPVAQPRPRPSGPLRQTLIASALIGPTHLSRLGLGLAGGGGGRPGAREAV